MRNARTRVCLPLLFLHIWSSLTSRDSIRIWSWSDLYQNPVESWSNSDRFTIRIRSRSGQIRSLTCLRLESSRITTPVVMRDGGSWFHLISIRIRLWSDRIDTSCVQELGYNIHDRRHQRNLTKFDEDDAATATCMDHIFLNISPLIC